MKIIKGIFKTLLAIVIIIILAIIILFAVNSYTSPVREAGRDFKRTVRSYRNDEVEDMEDVYERIAALQKHYNSTTHSKMQGGEKLKVTPQHIKTMFGEPDAMHNDVDRGHGKTNIYQYQYGAETLNLHEDWEGVKEFILEDYSGEFYTPEELDNLFFEAIEFHQTNYEKVEDEFKLLPEAEISSFTGSEEPTRKIWQGGWHTWPFDHERYYDDGKGDMSPEEFLMLRVVEDDEENKSLDWLYRRYGDAYDEINTPEEVEEKRGIWNDWRLYFKEIEDEDLNSNVTVQDLTDDYGDITRLTYDFRTGTLEVNWLVLEQDESALEINANILMLVDNVPTKKEDLFGLEVKSVGADTLYKNASILTTDDFMGQ